MRLINTRTLRLEEFTDETEVKYVILSHRWEKEEVSFQDIQSLEICKAKQGFHKIQSFCLEAQNNGYEYGWVDTCCIDKSSSAELSEAINSMFRWYSVAAECYVFLCDVDNNRERFGKQFVSSEWFERGWTLQELVAPKSVTFFDKNWMFLGTKHTLVSEIERISGVPKDVLYGHHDILTYSIAARMHWAAGRKTTRVEDTAYCLMGIFNINMPLLYGEGKKAFLRLQEEIIKRSEDDSIFAWSGVSLTGSGLLADHPQLFANASPIVDMEDKGIQETPPLMNSRGVCVRLRLTPWAPKIYLAFLKWRTKKCRVGIFIERLNEDVYRRVSLSGQPDIFYDRQELYNATNRPFQYRSICVRQQGWGASIPIPSPLPRNLSAVHGVRVTDYDLLPLSETNGIVPETGVAFLEPGAEFGTLIDIELSSGNWTVAAIKIGLDFDFHPCCAIANTANAYDSWLSYDEIDDDLEHITHGKSIWDVNFKEDIKFWTTNEQNKSVKPFQKTSDGSDTAKLWTFIYHSPDTSRRSFFLQDLGSDPAIAAAVSAWLETDAEGRTLCVFNFDLGRSFEHDLEVET